MTAYIMYIDNGKPVYVNGIVAATAFEAGIRRLDRQGSPLAEGVPSWRLVKLVFWGDHHE
jgi:hypothetical protein